MSKTMSKTMPKTICRSLVSALALALLASCGGDPKDDVAGIPACADDELRIVGNLEGAPVSVVESSAGGGFSQDTEGGELDTQAALDTPDAARSHLKVTWKKGFLIGDGADITGTLVLPPGSPRAGEKLCVGAGSRIFQPNDDDTSLRLEGLATGAGCETKLAGELRMCWR